ncbi:MAG: hypothetical protein AAFX87_20695 [Bacteroidota bacterium]
MSQTADKYPEIEALQNAVINNRIRFNIPSREPALEKVFFKRINFRCDGKAFSIAVQDEYSDVEKMKPVLLLHLVIQECEFYEEAEDYLQWCKDVGVKAEDITARAIYFEHREVIPKIRETLGDDLEAVNYYHIEFNTDTAQTLRNTTLKNERDYFY